VPPAIEKESCRQQAGIVFHHGAHCRVDTAGAELMPKRIQVNRGDRAVVRLDLLPVVDVIQGHGVEYP
jgi:hypothetical protein